MIHRLAKTYGCTPGDVTRWSADDVYLAVLCLHEAESATVRMVAGKTVFPTLEVGL